MTRFDKLTRFDTVLIANRGEIAGRILRAAKAAGLRTVAVYSDADADAAHVRAADIAVRIGPPPASQSYLCIPAILAAASAAGAGAVHPGYGFLSENAEFARACKTAGLVFIGPTAEVIELMGLKDSARVRAEQAGVPVFPAVGTVGLDEDEIVRRCKDLTFPLIVKAVAGGGGKGMHVVRDADRLRAALCAARAEAGAAFGSEELLVEQFVVRARHVEVQIFGDEHGNVVHLFDRDCSAQRRHQKVVEEAPAPDLPVELRERLLTSSVDLARAVGYVGAGTVEFVVHGQRASFLEMNTRLQVEHPVTEAITGIDLVRLQLRVAQGEPLGFDQSDVTAQGHAVEARVYAEDPATGFLPQAGRVDGLRWPAARVDSGIVTGSVVTSHYDPMLAKIVAHRPDRVSAFAALATALDDTAVLGLPTNIGFLSDLVRGDDLLAGRVHTTYLDEHLPTRLIDRANDYAEVACIAYAVLKVERKVGPFGSPLGWRLGGATAGARVSVLLRLDALAAPESARSVTISADCQSARVDDGRAYTVTRLADGVAVQRDSVRLVVRPLPTRRRRRGEIALAVGGRCWLASSDRPSSAASNKPGDGVILAPMPGTVVSVLVQPGDMVAAEQLLGTLEAMKMQLPITAGVDGVVSKTRVAIGAQVRRGEALFVIEPSDQARKESV